MRRALAGFLLLAGLLSVSASLAGFLAARSFFATVSPRLGPWLAGVGVRLRFASARPEGTALELDDVTLSARNIPYRLHTRAIRAHLGVGVGWRPLRLVVELDEPQIEAAAAEPAPVPSAAEPPSVGPAVGWALPWMQAQLAFNGALAPWGVEGCEASFVLRGIETAENGLGAATVDHDLRVTASSRYPWAVGMRWQGSSHYSPSRWTFTDQGVQWGPFLVELGGQYRFEDDAWSATLRVPQTAISPNAARVVSAAIPIRSVRGDLQLEAAVQGTGWDSDRIQGHGKIRVTDASWEIDEPGMLGTVRTTIDAEFARTARLFLRADAHADLTDAQLSHGGWFVKPKGIPVSLQLSVAGDERRLRLAHAELDWHSLKVTAGGDWGWEPRRDLNLDVTIPPTSLAGWETFFPTLGNRKLDGSLDGTLHYRGPWNAWQQARIDVSVGLRRLRFPVSALALVWPGLDGEGDGELRGEAHVVGEHGGVTSLYGRAQADLGAGRVGLGWFHKPAGEPLRVNADLTTEGKQLRLRYGELRLGGLVVPATGEVEGAFAGVSSARLRLQGDGLDAGEIARFVTGAPAVRRGKIDFDGALAYPARDVTVKLGWRGIGGDWDLGSSRGRIATDGMSGELSWQGPFVGGDAGRAEGRFRAKRLAVADAAATGVSGRFGWERGRGRLEPASFAFAGGDGTFSLGWDRAVTPPVATAALQLRHADAAAFLLCLLPVAHVAARGRADADVRWQWTGDELASFPRPPRADGSFRLTSLSVPAFSHGDFLEPLRRVPILGRSLDRLRLGSPFREVTAQFHLASNRLSLSQLLARHPGFEARSASAEIGPGDRVDTAWRWIPAADKLPPVLRYAAREPGIAVSVDGALSAPVLRVDSRVPRGRAISEAAGPPAPIEARVPVPSAVARGPAQPAPARVPAQAARGTAASARPLVGGETAAPPQSPPQLDRRGKGPPEMDGPPGGTRSLFR
jgi:hypothetical protein